VDRSALSIKGETGYEAPATSLSALILPSQRVPRFAVQERHQVNESAKTVKSILTKAGFKKNKQGYYALKGKVVKFSMEDPIAYSDYYATFNSCLGTKVRRHRRDG